MIAIVLVANATATDLKRADWHVPTREYAAYDSVAVPVVAFALIQKVHVGMSLEEVRRIVGFAPVDYSIHPAYAILMTEVDEQIYEVAFLHTKERKVEAISFRRSPWEKKPNQTPEPTRAAVTIPADAGLAPAARVAHL